ncbi:MAG TPA: histidine phosphatase family protein [Rubrivivax sp.]|nr:histidine phosphatase family protein [Rubrivivax sp.]HPO18247.1 histidine phosphatase family protein [Rubrivivax sp.]
MDLILWRHADAGNPLDDAVLDLQRPLSPKGARHAARIAEWLQRALPERTRVLVSPALRCQQTARSLGRKFHTRDALGPGGDVHALLALAGWPERRTPVLIVGHQPTLGAAAAWLMAGAAAGGAALRGSGAAALEAHAPGAPSWAMRKGAVWWLRRRERAGRVEVVLVAVRAPDEP